MQKDDNLTFWAKGLQWSREKFREIFTQFYTLTQLHEMFCRHARTIDSRFEKGTSNMRGVLHFYDAVPRTTYCAHETVRVIRAVL